MSFDIECKLNPTSYKTKNKVTLRLIPVNLKGNQPWILIGETDDEVEDPVFWSPNANSLLIGKVPDAGRDWGQKEKKASEDEMAGWHPWCNGHELGQTSGGGTE